jgi:hypothetical protein
MAREIKKRDEIIIMERDASIKRQKELADEVLQARRDGEADVSQVEVMYERKLAQESDYLTRMKQAMDEYVVHSRFDLEDARASSEARAAQTASSHNAALEESERQKKTLLKYVDYVNLRYSEVLDNMEDSHEGERADLKQKAVEAKQGVKAAAERQIKDMATLQQALKKSQLETEDREVALMKLKGAMFEATSRVELLETALSSATDEITKCRDSAQRWELRAGSSQQSLIEIERVRETLTSQLHLLRKELAPKEWELISSKHKLREMGGEYADTMVSVAEKDRELTTQSGKIHLLSKQVRALRTGFGQRDRTLRRACKVFEEYQEALQQAVFHRTKTSIITTYVPQIGLTPQEAARQQAIEAAAVAEEKEREAEEEHARRDEEYAAAVAAETDPAAGLVPPLERPRPSGGAGAARPMALPSEYHAINAKKLELAAARVSVTEPLNSPELVELMCKSPAMSTAINTLVSLLKPYSDDADKSGVNAMEGEEVSQKEAETNRQLDQMRRTVTAALSNSETTRKASFMHTKHHVADNRGLLAQLNDQREELILTRREKERLAARVNFFEGAERRAKAGRTNMSGRSGRGGDNGDNHSVMSEMSSQYDNKAAETYRGAISAPIKAPAPQLLGEEIEIMDDIPSSPAATGARLGEKAGAGVEFVPDMSLTSAEAEAHAVASTDAATGTGGAREKIDALIDMNNAQLEQERGDLTTPDQLMQQYSQIVMNDSLEGSNVRIGETSSEGVGAPHAPQGPGQGLNQLPWNGGGGDGRSKAAAGKSAEMHRIRAIVGAINPAGPLGFRDGEESSGRKAENRSKAKEAVERSRAIKKALMSRNTSAPQLIGGAGGAGGARPPQAPTGLGGSVRLTQTLQLTPKVGLPPLIKKRNEVAGLGAKKAKGV